MGQIWTELTRRYGLPLVLLEHHQRPRTREGAANCPGSADERMPAPKWALLRRR